MRAIKLVVATLALSLLSSWTYAANETQQELTGTLKKIKASGKIVLGVRDISVPFSYLDDKQTYQGYSIDICLKIVDSLRKQLAMPGLKIVMNPVTSATRIPLITNGTIDLECGSTSNNLERQKQIAFAPTTFVSGARLLSKKSSNVTTLADLKGKTIASTSGTNILKQLTKINSEKNLGMKIMPTKDHSEGFLMVETGRSVAFAMDDILLASFAANSKTPGEYSISKEAITVEPYAIMLRQGDQEFKKSVDMAVTALFKSGEINTIYDKWFTKPIPPKGINLNWPMPDNLKVVIAHPTDSGDPDTYVSATQNKPDGAIPSKPSAKNKSAL